MFFVLGAPLSAWALPPDSISNLTAIAGNNLNEVTLSWTAPGGDGGTGTADGYFVRSSTIAQITDDVDFWNADFLGRVWTPQAAGSAETQTVTGLTAGVTHYFAIKAYHTVNGTAAWNAGAVNTLNSARAQFMSGLSWTTHTYVSSSAIHWAWTDVTLESGYRIINATSSVNVSGDLAPDTTFFLETDLIPNTTYQVYHQSFDGAATLTSATTLQVTLATSPAALAISTRTQTTIDIQWTANGNPNGTHFRAERSTDGVSGWTEVVSLSTSLTFQDSVLNENTSYYYRVQAVSHASSTTSFTSTVSTITTWIPPNAISSLSASPGSADGEVDLIWTAPGDDGGTGTVSTYQVRYATFNITSANFDDGNVSVFNHAWGSLQVGGSPESRTITGLTPSVTYFFAIKGVDSGGAADWSDAANANRSDYATDLDPPVPAGLSALGGDHQMTLSWTAVSGIPDLEGYWVERATASDFATVVVIATVSSVATSTTDVSLSNQTTYFYRIRSIDTGPVYLYSAYSSTISASTLDTIAPNFVNNLGAGQGPVEGEFELTWAWTGDDGFSGDIVNGSFRIQVSTNSSEAWNPSSYTFQSSTNALAGATHTVTLTGLSPGATYYSRIWLLDEAVNISSISIGATDFAQVDVTSPSTISDLSGVTDWRQVALTWTAPGDDGAVNVLFGTYEIAFGPSDITNLTQFQGAPGQVAIATNVTPGATVSYTLTGLTNGASNYVSIRALDDFNNASGISPALVITPVNSSPQEFSVVSPSDNAIVSTNTPVLDWSVSADSNTALGDAVSYTLEVSTSSGFEVTATTTTSGLSVSSHVPQAFGEDETIFWRVTAFDLDGSSVVISSSPLRVRINVVQSTPTLPSFSSPADEAIVTVDPPVLDWTDSIETDPGESVSYVIDISTDPGFAVVHSSFTSSASSVSASGLTEDSTYFWRVTATDGALSVSTSSRSFSLNAVDEAPSPFSLLTPAHETRLLTLTPTFTWQESSDLDPGDSFQYELNYSNFANFAASTTVLLTTTTYTLPAQPDNINLYWFVKAIDSDNLTTNSSETFRAYTDTAKELPQAFSLLTPTNTAVVTDLTPLFDWADSVDPDPFDTVRYILELSPGDPTFSSPQAIQTGADSFYQPGSNLADHTTYYWRVKAGGYQGAPPVLVDSTLTVSGVFSFVLDTVNVAPQDFDLLTPAHGSSVQTRTPTLTWEEAVDTNDDTVVYTVEVSTSSDFGGLAASTSAYSNRSWTVTPALNENRNYYWRVRAVDNSSAVTYSQSTFTFTVPVVTRPRPPNGFVGALSPSATSWTMVWQTTVENTDGSAADDLTGYRIYRSLSNLDLGEGTPIATLTINNNQYTDNTVGGLDYYYAIRTYDESGIESLNSNVLRASDSPATYYVSDKKDLVLTLDALTAAQVLGTSPSTRRILLSEGTPLTGRSLSHYQVRVERESDGSLLSGYRFNQPITISFYLPLVIASAQQVSAQAVSYGPTDAAVYWFNGVEYVKMGGSIDATGNWLTLHTLQTGNFEVRQAVRSSAFEISRIYPKKTFTPNGDGVNDTITFVFENPKDASFTGKIFNLSGSHVGDMATGSDGSSLVWDGRTTGGAYADKGVYIYQIEGDGTTLNGTIVVAR